MAIDSNDILLMQSNSVDNDTEMLDGTEKQTLTTTGGIYHDTAQSVFGKSSMYHDGSANPIVWNDSIDFTMAAGDFTIDAWIRVERDSGAGQTICSHWSTTSGYKSYIFSYNAGTGQLNFLYSTNGSANSGQYLNTVNLSLNTWYHIAIERSGTVLQFYVDGVKASASHTIGTTSLFNAPMGYRVGAYIDGASAINKLNGWMDELRIGKGIARYGLTNFTPPTEPYLPLAGGINLMPRRRRRY